MNYGSNMNRTVKGVAGAIYGTMVKHYMTRKLHCQNVVKAVGGRGQNTNNRVLSFSEMKIPGYELFYESESTARLSKSGDPREFNGFPPRVTYIYSFIHNIFRRAQVEPECLIAAVIYLKRFMDASLVPLTVSTYRRVTFISIVVASKAWDDVSCTTRSFYRVSDMSFSLRELCMMERIFLEAIGYKLYLTADDYKQAYYGMKGIWLGMQVCSDGMIHHDETDTGEFAVAEEYGPRTLFTFEEELMNNGQNI